jgi:hypothetical protein
MKPELREYILLRDGGCVARFVESKLELMRWPMLAGLPKPGLCRNEFGGEINPNSLLGLQIDHVKDFATMGGGRVDLIDEMWTLCPYHHMGTIAGHAWALKTEVRVAARLYIRLANERARQRGYPPLPYEEVIEA